jgi:ssDNA-binding Zn-finger/Zn-ribbon topoisomerase 1
MSTLAEIIQQYGPAYQQKFNDRLLPSHRRALWDIAHCRTAAFGGHLYQCPDCQAQHYQYHSCQNRHCPQCQYQAGQEWLTKQQALLLPVPYFMVTFTLPEAVRPLARSNQRLIYDLLFRASAAATKALAWDPRYVGGQIGMVGVLHTWGRQLTYHPHVHYLVPAGALAADGQQWLASRPNFLVPVRALSRLFRAKFRDGLQATSLFDQISAETWQEEWVVHCKSVGDGTHALRYLAPYIFRVAISNHRILNVNKEKVTFRYRVSDTGQIRLSTLTAEEFLRRFLQHVLPKGFVKVRYYGLFSPALRDLLPLLHLWIDGSSSATTLKDETHDSTSPISPNPNVLCPTCGQVMHPLRKLRPRSRCPP